MQRPRVGNHPPLPNLHRWTGHFQVQRGSVGRKRFFVDETFLFPRHNIQPPNKGLLPISFSSPEYSDEVNLFILSSAAAVCKGVLIPYYGRFHVYTTRRTGRPQQHGAIAFSVGFATSSIMLEQQIDRLTLT